MLPFGKIAKILKRHSGQLSDEFFAGPVPVLDKTR
jgi:hypothetical protein